ncbi:MAG: hypothetical protein WCZ89_08310 [Phycisphaerae bacterium]
MRRKIKKFIPLLLMIGLSSICYGRIKLSALPERAATIIRLDNPNATLIEEERVLTLQKGINTVDFSWRGVSIDEDSIRLVAIDHPETVILLNVSYPPGEAALVWQISCDGDYAETVRISYLLNNIDRLITYRAVADKSETAVDLQSYLVLRNFSGEDFGLSRILLDYGEAFEKTIAHEETKTLAFMQAGQVPIKKIWTFDARTLPWDPSQLENQNVGIPVTYEITNDIKNKLGKHSLWAGKARVFQDDGHGSTIFLGEDYARQVPVGEKMELYIGDSRDIVVTQRKMKEDRINIRRNNKNHIILYDTDEEIVAKIENFKDSPAVLTVIEYIPGQWEMKKCNMKYTLIDAETLKFQVELGARSNKELKMQYSRKNIRTERRMDINRY